MDGAVWLWHLARERFSEATLILDFHHARDHLKAVERLSTGRTRPPCTPGWIRWWNNSKKAKKPG